jgi:hypothetical protein
LDDLILEDVAMLGDPPLLHHLIAGTLLHAGDERDPLPAPTTEQRVVVNCQDIMHKNSGHDIVH